MIKKTVTSFLLTLCFCGSVFASGYTAQEETSWKEFGSKIRLIKEQYERGTVSAEDVERILGQPNHKNDESIKVEGGKEVWHYWHPVMATVRYLFVFNKDGQLVLLTSAQILRPDIGSRFMDVDFFLFDK